ncbi:MAG TPA: prepilin-type N-terminal cleavage/methylation domain-containing protein [Candidatus Staskawiczbacteria bacterium]|nr:prepilin-type N-terminal cleavage/methylation domain-containing protein [Candidatus Staskawiczbacteria bacterium]
MQSNKNKKLSKGSTLIEVIVSISIIAIFSIIVVSDFPTIKRQFAISRAAYALSQNIRKAEDFGFSGLQVTDGDGDTVNTTGYGFYINPVSDTQEYLIYADTDGSQDEEFSGGESCENNQVLPDQDCIVEQTNLADIEQEVYIKGIYRLTSCTLEDISFCPSTDWVSINFMPPNPTVKITNDQGELESKIGILLGANNASTERVVFVNSTGLIYVK